MEYNKLQLKFFTYAAGVITASIGFLVLIGWQFDVEILKTFLPKAVSMKANTAAAFLLAGLALIVLQRSSTVGNILVRFCGFVVMLTGLISLSQYLFGWDVGFNELLYREAVGTVGTSHPGLMAPNTAVNFLLIGIALFLLTFQRYSKHFLIEFLLIFALIVSVLGFIGYLTGLVELTGPSAFTQMAVNTASVFIILCVGMILTVYERQHAPILIEQKLFACLTTAAAVIMFITFLSVSSIKSLTRASDWIEVVQHNKNQIGAVLTQVLDVQSSERGYILTGDDSYLVAYKKSTDELPILLTNLKSLIVDSPRQQKMFTSLEKLVGERLTLTKNRISTMKTEGKSKALLLYPIGRGKAITDSIRVIVAQMIAEEDSILQTRIEDKERETNHVLLIIYLSLSVQLFLLSFIFIVMYKDVTGRKKAEEKLRVANEELEERIRKRTSDLAESERNYRNLADDAVVGIYRSTMKGDILYVNEAMARMMEFDSPESMIRSGAIARWREPNERLVFLERLQRDGKVGAFETVFLTANGKPIDVLISARIDEDKITGTILDITERKLKNEKLQEREARLREAQRIGKMGCWQLDLIENCLTWSDEIFLMFEINPKQFGASYEAFLQAIHPDDREMVNKAYTESVRNRMPYKIEHRLQMLDGRIKFVEERCETFYDVVGKPLRSIGTVQDITERKSLEKQVLHFQRMESIGTLAGGIAHDLNNILAPILLSLNIINKKLIDEQSKKMIQMLETTTKRGADLINQILSFARRGEGERTVTQVHHLTNEIEKIIRETFPKSITLRMDVSKNLPPITAKATQIHQVLMNLCVNARDAMPNGGTITIKAERIIIDELYARIHIDAKTGPYIVISVTDQGIGIPPENIDRIFEPFFTTKEVGMGTGLGLYTVYSIIKSHNGFLKVHSEVGKGTTFDIYLPIQEVTETAVTEEKAELPLGNGELILLVEDENSIREITKTALETFGYSVIDAIDGTEAIVAYATHREKIALVVTDMMMPIMDGASTIRAIQQLNPKAKFIAVSGSKQDEKIADQETVTFLQKPYTSEKLLKIVGAMLQQK